MLSVISEIVNKRYFVNLTFELYITVFSKRETPKIKGGERRKTYTLKKRKSTLVQGTVL